MMLKKRYIRIACFSLSVLAFSLIFLAVISAQFTDARAPYPRGSGFAPQKPSARFDGNGYKFKPPLPNLNPEASHRGAATPPVELFPDIPRQNIYRLRCTPRLNPYCSGEYTLSDLQAGIGTADLQRVIDNCRTLGIQPYKSRTWIDPLPKLNGEDGLPRRANPSDAWLIPPAIEGLFIYCYAQLQITSAPTVSLDAEAHRTTISWQTSINANATATLRIRGEASEIQQNHPALNLQNHEFTFVSFRDVAAYEVTVQNCNGIPTTQCVSQTIPFATPNTTPVSLHTFDGVGIATITTFNAGGDEELFVGTFREGIANRGAVLMSNNGETWEQVWLADSTPTMTGVYASAVANEAGVPTLYIGTGGAQAGDAQIWKTTNGREWTRVDSFSHDEKKVNQLKMINNRVYAASTTYAERGSLCYLDFPVMLCSETFSMPVISVEEFNEKIYVATFLPAIYEKQVDGSFSIVADLSFVTGEVNQLHKYNGKLYLATNGGFGEPDLLSSTDARIWTGETVGRSTSVRKLDVLSNGNLYLSVPERGNAKLYKKTVAGINLFIAEFTGLGTTNGVAEKGGRRYAVANQGRLIDGRPEVVMSQILMFGE